MSHQPQGTTDQSRTPDQRGEWEQMEEQGVGEMGQPHSLDRTPTGGNQGMPEGHLPKPQTGEVDERVHQTPNQ